MKIICKKNEQIILELANSEIRVYLSKEGRAVQLTRPVGDTLAKVLEAVLTNEFATLKNVDLILLCSDCFSQTVTIPSSQQQGLTDNELKKVLAFEVEPFSGVSPEESILAFAKTSLTDELAVVQFSKTELNSLLRVTKALGVNLRAVFAANAQLELEPLAETERRHKEIADTSLALLAKRYPIIIIKDAFSKNIIQRLEELSPESFKRVLLGAALITIILCGLHYWVYSGIIIKSKQNQAARLEAPMAAINATNNAIRKLEREIKLLKENSVSNSDVKTRLAARHLAWNSLFKIIAKSCGEFAFVKSIEGSPDCVSLVVFSVHKDAEMLLNEKLLKNGVNEIGWIFDSQNTRELSPNEFRVVFSYNEQLAVSTYLNKQKSHNAVRGE